MSSYEIYKRMTPEEKHKYHEDWDKHKESFHDVELEKHIGEMNIQIELEYKFSYEHQKDFEITYTDDKEDLDQLYWYRKDLKMLFAKGFKWILIKEKTELYKIIKNKHPRALRSPNTNICGTNNQGLCLFIKDDSIYVASGRAFYRNTTTQYFMYIGRILQKGEIQQLTIFDI